MKSEVNRRLSFLDIILNIKITKLLLTGFTKQHFLADTCNSTQTILFVIRLASSVVL